MAHRLQGEPGAVGGCRARGLHVQGHIGWDAPTAFPKAFLQSTAERALCWQMVLDRARGYRVLEHRRRPVRHSGA